MKKKVKNVKCKRLATGLLSCMLLSAAITVVQPTPMLIVASAHSGRNDFSRGHHDNKNRSGVDSYYYHCGENPAHLHPHGVCPYSTTTTEVRETAAETTEAETKAAEKREITGSWQQNDKGWWYQLSDNTYYASGFAKIGGKDYYFDADGYMVTGRKTLDGTVYQFGDDGALIK